MSHKASHWLADIPAEAINACAFRVLFHLCDAHNSQRDPESACFPGQEKLRASTGLSNGGLNNALNALEAANLIRRRRTRNADGTRGPTYYILGCDLDLAHQPSPQNGDGGGAGKPARPSCGPTVDKSPAISNSRPRPTPLSGPSHLQSAGVEPLRDPIKEPSRARAAISAPVDIDRGTPEHRAAVVAALAEKYPGLLQRK
jgi:hypothetical protein